ncbi:astacin, partial [Ancylostoma duodenale]
MSGNVSHSVMGGVLTFLSVACINGIVLGDFDQSGNKELVNRFDRYRRQAQIRGPGVVASKVLNYFFDGRIRPEAKELFSKAKKVWEQNTCVKFKQNEQATTKILVTDEGTKCLFKRNQDGKGLQTLYLGCGYYGGAAHEIGHALWLDHTHNRHDRDLYLDVNDENIR